MRFIWMMVAGLGLLVTSDCFAQGGGLGAGGGAGAAYNAFQNQPSSSSQSAVHSNLETIQVTGSAEISIEPEALRLVFAVAQSKETSQATAASVKTAVANLRKAIEELGIEASDVVEDFIVMRPRYEWKVEKLDKKDKYPIATETKIGFKMQTNLHVMCKDEKQALAVIDIAFENGVSEIISFDYWHSGLDEQKRLATKQALAEAKRKSDLLLAVFDDKPRILNVADQVTVSHPQSQYKTIVEPADPSANRYPYNWSNAYKIFAYRPKITFYAGSNLYSDASPKRPPMNPEISVHAKVTLVYSSPARDEQLKIEQLKASNREK